MGVPKLFAAKCNTALICSRVTENSSMTSSTVKPASKFSNTVATGIRVSLNTHAPLTLPGMLSTAGHWDQSRGVMFSSSFHRSLLLRMGVVVTQFNVHRHHGSGKQQQEVATRLRRPAGFPSRYFTP